MSDPQFPPREPQELFPEAFLDDLCPIDIDGGQRDVVGW